MPRPGCSSTASRCSGSRPSCRRADPAYEDMVTSFLEHAVRITAAMNRSGLWDETDGFYYDALKLADGSAVPIKVHSMVGLIPLLPSAEVPAWSVDRGARLGKRFASFLEGMRVTDAAPARGRLPRRRSRAARAFMVSVVPPARFTKLLARDARRGRLPRADRPARALQASRDRAVQARARRADRRGRLRARRIDVGPVRREFELARTDLVPAQLPDDPGAPQLGYLARRGQLRRISRPAPGKQVRLRDVSADLAQPA